MAMPMAHVESTRERRHLVKDAGFPTTSFVSVVAGFLVALGAIALIGAIVAAVGSELGISTDGVSTEEWRQAGIGGAVAAAVVFFLSFFFGGYTAGRMGRRAGALHGGLVFVLALVAFAVVVALAAIFGDADSARDALQDEGIPTDANTWSDIGIGAGIATLLAMLVGSVLGGALGERWHGKLLSAYADRHEPANVRRTRDDDTHVVRDDGSTVDLTDDHDRDTLSLEEQRELERRR
jgi:hypothetical protein